MNDGIFGSMVLTAILATDSSLSLNVHTAKGLGFDSDTSLHARTAQSLEDVRTAMSLDDVRTAKSFMCETEESSESLRTARFSEDCADFDGAVSTVIFFQQRLLVRFAHGS